MRWSVPIVRNEGSIAESCEERKVRNGEPERKMLGEMPNAKEFIRVISFLFKTKGYIGALKYEALVLRVWGVDVRSETDIVALKFAVEPDTGYSGKKP